MKVTITEFDRIGTDIDANDMPIVGSGLRTQKMTGAGSSTATGDDCRVIRICSDTAIHYKLGTGVDDTHAMLPANVLEYRACGEGVQISIIAA